MKKLFILVIHIYWCLIPKEKRRSCIFSVSCSNYVVQKLKLEGTISGLKAFLFRFKNCQKGFKIKLEGDQFLFYTVKNTSVNQNDVHPSIVKAFYDSNNFNKKMKSATVKSKLSTVTQ